jgi:raffinose/stachyose/melibiose transport system substrate-binding protein
MTLSERTEPPGSSDDGAHRISRRRFTQLLGVGLGSAAMAELLAPVAGASTRLGSAGGLARAGKPTLDVSVQTSDQPALAAIAKLYEKTGAANLKLAGISDEDWDVVLPRLFAAGTVGDMALVQPGGGTPVAIETLAPYGYLLDLSDQPFVKKIPKSVLPVCTVGGKVYMAPVTGGAMVVFYNKALFKKVGATVPTTWPQFLAVCAKLKAAGKIPIWFDASNASNGGVNSLFITYPLVSATSAGLPSFAANMKKGKAKFANSGWVQALRNYLLLYNEGYYSPNPLGGAPLSQLADNEAAMYCFVSQGLATAAAGFGMANTGAFIMPNADTASKVVANAGSGAGYVITSTTKSPKASKALINYMCTMNSVAVYDRIDGGLPLLQASSGAVPQLFVPNVIPFLKAGRTATYFDQQWPNAQVRSALTVGCQEILSGQSTIPDVLDAMDTAYREGA